YVVNLCDIAPVESVRPLIDLPDSDPVFSPEIMELCRWLADYYCCSWGEALHSAIPAGISVRTRMMYRLCMDRVTSGRFTDRQRAVVAELNRRGPLSEKQLAKSVGPVALSNTLKALVGRGILEAEPVAAAPAVNALTETWVKIVERAVLSSGDLEVLQRRAPKQAAVYLDLLHGGVEQRAALACAKHETSATVLRQLASKGLVTLIEKDVYRTPDEVGAAGSSRKHALNPEQRAAYEAIVAELEANRFQTFLLQGITGSGKTEVYLQAIERALSLGKAAIILVPEISLTPQTVGRFKARYQTDVAVLHSGLGPGERYDEWRRAQRGEVRIVVGARSAVFAPLPNLGILVVDEEHDNSYKQNESPRYHARDVAIMRAKMNNAVCLLGSATPSVESYHNSQTGKSVRLELKRRAAAAELPRVEIIDMRVETRDIGVNVMLSRRLEEEIAARIKSGDQVLLLLNRRGFSPYVLCPSCGWVAECTDCNVSLTYHAQGSFLCCHYCGYRRESPQVCDACGFKPLLHLGTGTQKIEDYLLRSFPEARVERMDADTTSSKGAHAHILGRLAAGEIDILIGTQMIAKGHDYPGVTLVGVVNADTGLSFPDFRASETTFQLLTQVAGRAGRGDRPGLVLIQSYRPNHYAVQAAAKHDFAAFYEREMVTRESALYPPLRRMACIMVEGEDPEETYRTAIRIGKTARAKIEELGFAGIELLGPAPATLRRLKRKYRWSVGLLSKSTKRLNQLTRAVRDAFDASPDKGKCAVKVDLDPYGMM
ncbi:MAG: primosomal protein N', partial [Candidatus Hydrogenedentes bacterium]|nr:primosomal protein N' [Candidatus Hydrogenedentota bacterium]